MNKIDVAAYVWPAYTGEERRSRIFWSEGYGEWETVKAAVARYEGHQWPRKPLWGYTNEADPYVMEMQIEAATDHGVNVFIYDWYWYDNRPFLEQCLDNGFLKAKNRSKMKFYIMWANHDVTYGWDRRISIEDYETHVWKGAVSPEQFHIIAQRWMEQYFCQPEYYVVDNRPVVSIYDLQNLIEGMGGIEETQRELNWLNDEVKKLGFDGVHYQLVKFGTVEINRSGFDREKHIYHPEDLAKILPFSSLTHYQFAHFVNMGQKYCDILKEVQEEWKQIDRSFSIPYFPHISIGWDNTPRYKTHVGNVVKENTPEEFEKALQLAKEYAVEKEIPMITINSWNEWTEGSYLQPDDLYGYGYLEAIRKTFA